MKKPKNMLLSNFSKGVLEDLTKEVKETIAFDLAGGSHKSFTTTDLWNIRNQAKSRVQRRYL